MTWTSYTFEAFWPRKRNHGSGALVDLRLAIGVRLTCGCLRCCARGGSLPAAAAERQRRIGGCCSGKSSSSRSATTSTWTTQYYNVDYLDVIWTHHHGGTAGGSLAGDYAGCTSGSGGSTCCTWSIGNGRWWIIWGINFRNASKVINCPESFGNAASSEDRTTWQGFRFSFRQIRDGPIET